MASTFGALRNKMGSRADHPSYQEKTFKEHAQATIRAGREIELWAQDMPSSAAMLAKEDQLNRQYCGLWTKEGKTLRLRVRTPVDGPTADRCAV